MNRRSFLTGLIGAPVVMKAESLMPVWPWKPVLYGDGIHDDWAALQALLNDERVDVRSKRIWYPEHAPELGLTSFQNTYSLSRPLIFRANTWRRDAFIGDSFLKHPKFPPGESLLIWEKGAHHGCFMSVYSEGECQNAFGWARDL